MNTHKSKSLAPTIVKLNGWTRSDAIIEIMDYDGVDEAEAARRYDRALQSYSNRCIANRRNADLRAQGIADAQADVDSGLLIHALGGGMDKYKAWRSGYYGELRRLGAVA